MHKRILIRLDRLNAARSVDDVNLPGYDFHALRGFKPIRYTIHINGPWCITFEFEGQDAFRVDLNSTTEEHPMTEYKAVRGKNRCPSHPGAAIADILLDVPKPKTEIAAMLGISRQQLHDILAERKPLSPDISVRIGKVFGGSAESWLRMQAAYDAWHAERRVDVSKIPALALA